MIRFFQGFACAYGIATLYFCAILSMPGVTRPPGAAPIAAIGWPLVMAAIFWADLGKIECKAPRPDQGGANTEAGR